MPLSLDGTYEYGVTPGETFQGSKDFDLPVPAEASRRLAAGWLWLGVASLVGAGLFAMLVVLARAPYVSSIFPTVDFFRTALVVHVDLSVLLWFFAFACVLWSAVSPPKWIPLGWAALLLCAAGALLIVISPFIGAGAPLMNNYVPILDNWQFLTGLTLFGCGIGLLTLRSLLTIPSLGFGADGAGALRFGLYAAAVATAMALVAFAWAYATIPYFVSGQSYFEFLFWGGGHVMQYTYTLLMLAGWLWLASVSGVRLLVTSRVALVLFVLGIIPILFTPLIYAMFETASGDNMEMFVMMMRIGGSFAAVPLGLAVVYGVMVSDRPAPDQRPMFAPLLCSIVLFGVGGGISLMINGSNTIITAHYHGTGGAVSLAFMGLTYVLLPKLGFRAPDAKTAQLQAYVYGGGQLLHIIGLLWSGGYGVQRKVAGADQGLHSFGQIAGMGLMGIGGLIAVIGGLMFLVVVFKAMRVRTR